MIEWEVAEDHLRVFDADNAELVVGGELLVVDESGSDLPRPVDETLVVETTELRFPHAVVYAFVVGRVDQFQLDPGGKPLSLDPGEYVVDVDTEIKTYLRFSGAATVRKTGDFSNVVVSFPERTRVIVGFRSRHELPTGTITVPETVDGVASALTHLASSHKTERPDRTYPTLRGHPPLLECGDRLEVPDHVQRATPDSEIQLRVPRRLEELFVVAPLAYYLQAEVTVTDLDQPVLRLPDHALERTLGTSLDVESAVRRLLEKTFFLDCLVRNAGPYGTNLAELSILDALRLDEGELYTASIEDRLASYLDIPYAALEHRIPDWHLSTYVTPSFENVEALPYLLDRLSLIYPPRTSELEGRELVERSLNDFYRGVTDDEGALTNDEDVLTNDEDVRSSARVGAGQVASVDVVKPDLRTGRVHGWLADGVPIDVFKLRREAYENRFTYLERESDGISIVVVLNDPEMAGEQATVAEIYRRRSEELSIALTVEESLSTAEMARLFERGCDFLHYIGHCETDGLRCPDGFLSTSSLDRCAVQTFFLNACGSFYEGMDLVERGSVAGAVTFTQVLNEHAVTVGSTFAKLLVHGFSIERAMRLARRRIMMGKDYAVVGDGTHSLTQGAQWVPTTVTVDRLADGGYVLTVDCYSTGGVGSYYFPHVDDNEYAHLCGSESTFTCTRAELVDFLEQTAAAVIYDGDLYWSSQLWARLDADEERPA